MNSKKAFVKFVVLSIAVLVMMCSYVMLSKTKTIWKPESYNVQAYNHNAGNILDNVFEKDGLTILPIIYSDAAEQISKSDVTKDVQSAGMVLKSISTDNIVTGTKIVTNSKTYTVVVYGDIDADGYVDVFDIRKIVRHYLYGGSDELKGIYKIAANLDNTDNETDVFDIQRVVRFYLGRDTKLVVNEPVSIKETDTTKPVITLNGASTVTVQVKGTYTDAGATARDNVDGTISVRISGTVNVNKVGTYTILYNATDKAGNKAAQVTRTVKVVDTTKPVITLTGASTVTVQVKGTYTELGATATDNYDGSITSKIVKTGTVNTSVVGTYTVKYNVKDTNGNSAVEVTRTVRVVDTTKPVITLNGAAAMTVQVKGTYTELGATATDNYDGNITSKIVKTGTVNTSVVGTYTLKYNVKDANGNNATEVTRTVNVVDYATAIEATSTKSMYDLNEALALTVKVVMASGSKVTLTESQYTVTGYSSASEGTKTVTVTYKENTSLTDSFSVTVADSTKVTEIIIADITEDDEFRVGHGKEKAITFENAFENAVTVTADEVDVFTATGITTTLLNKDKLEIEDATSDKAVAYIRFDTTTKVADSEEISITVDGLSQTVDVAIVPEGEVVKINTGDITKVELVIANPGNNANIITDSDVPNFDDGVYLLIPVELEDTYGDIVDLQASNVVNDVEDFSEGMLLCADSIYLADPAGEMFSYIGIKPFDRDKVEATGTTLVAYIGVSVKTPEDMYSLDGANIVLKYGITNPVVKNVKIELPSNPTVTTITVLDVTEADEFRVGKVVEKEITFKNAYNNVVEVLASRINITKPAGVDVTLLNLVGNEITEDSDGPVKKIRFETTIDTETLNNEVAIEVDGVEEPILVDVVAEGVVNEIVSASSITLVTTDPLIGTDNIVTEDDGIYVLIPVSLLDTYGDSVKIEAEDVVTYEEELEDGMLLCADSVYFEDTAGNFPLVYIKCFGEDKEEIITGTSEITYIGIAVVEPSEIEDLRGESIKFVYQVDEFTQRELVVPIILPIL